MRQVLLKLVGISGFICVIASTCCAWYCVPLAVTVTEHGDWEAIRVGVSGTATVFKVGLLGLLLLATLVHRLTPQYDKTAVVLTTASCCMCCFFPHCQLTWEPQLAARASWLHLQHENLTWLGGDIFRNQEHEQSPQQLELYVSDSPRQVSVLPTPGWSLQQISLSQLPELFAWLGFTNAFCQFVCRGWLLAVMGTSLIVITAVFASSRQEMDLLRMAINTAMVLGGLGLVIAWYSPLWAGVLLNRAAGLTFRGNHAAAVVELDHAANVWKPLKEHTDFVVQHGLSDLASNQSTPHAKLYHARLLERDGQTVRAVNVYRQLLESEPADSPVRREACRGVLRHAERAANSGQWLQALNGTTLVIRHDPCNIKALYAALVCYMQAGDARGAQTTYQQLQSVYHFLNYPDKRIVLGKAREMAVKTLLHHAS